MPLHKRDSAGAKMHMPHLRFGAYGLLLLLISLLQGAPMVFPAISGAHPSPLIPAVVCIAMFEGPIVGAVVGVASGMLWGIYATRLFGFDALLLLTVGCLCGILVRVLLRNNWMSALLLNGAVLLGYTLIDWIARFVLFYDTDVVYALTHVLLPNALYTWALSPLVYWIFYRVARSLRQMS